MEVKEKFAMDNAICKGVFHLQGWNDDQSANLRNFSLSLFMSRPSSSVDLGRGRKLGNLGESVFRGFSLRVFHLALYPKPKTWS